MLLWVTTILYSPGQRLFACTPKNEIRMFEGDKLVSEYRNQEEDLRLYCMQKSPDNKIITGWNDGSVRWLNA